MKFFDKKMKKIIEKSIKLIQIKLTIEFPLQKAIRDVLEFGERVILVASSVVKVQRYRKRQREKMEGGRGGGKKKEKKRDECEVVVRQAYVSWSE